MFPRKRRGLISWELNLPGDSYIMKPRILVVDGVTPPPVAPNCTSTRPGPLLTSVHPSAIMIITK